MGEADAVMLSGQSNQNSAVVDKYFLVERRGGAGRRFFADPGRGGRRLPAD